MNCRLILKLRILLRRFPEPKPPETVHKVCDPSHLDKLAAGSEESQSHLDRLAAGSEESHLELGEQHNGLC